MYNEQLAVDTLLDAEEYTKKMLVAIEEINQSFLAGREDKALKQLPDLVDALEWLINVVDLTKPTQENYQVEFASTDRFLEILKDMVEAFKNTDYVLLGDLLNYEVGPIISDWDKQLTAFKSRLSVS